MVMQSAGRVRTRAARCLAALAVAVSAAVAANAWAQTSAGRGARDPLQVERIVGSEGKGMFTGAGIPPGFPPIFAAKDGAIPAGVQPLPRDFFTT